MEEDQRIIAGGEQVQDGWQYSLRPRRLQEYIGQEKVKENMTVFIQAALNAGKPWIMSCFMDRLALARRPLPTSSQTNWASISGLPADLPWNGRGT